MSKSISIAAPADPDELRQHCLAVAKCRVAHAVLTTPLRTLLPAERQCAAIISAQLGAAPAAEPPAVPPWLVPEPWNGHLDTARILFVGQNPSANHEEDYPTDIDGTIDRTDDELFAYFQGRFDPGTPGGIADGRRVQLRGGGWGRSNPFLTRVKNLAAEIWQRDAVPGQDYAITEAVRCKAANAIGVDFAMTTCSTKYLYTTLRLSASRVIVCMGTKARQAFQTATGAGHDELAEAFDWDGRKVVFIAHSNARPNARGRELPTRQFEILRAHLQAE